MSTRLSIYYRKYPPRQAQPKNGRHNAGTDVAVLEDVTLEPFEFKIIPLDGWVRLEDPDSDCRQAYPPGLHEHGYVLLVPRSSTFKRWRILQANSVGIIDSSYCGPGDRIGFACVYVPEKNNMDKPLTIPAGTYIAQVIPMVTAGIPVEIVEGQPSGDSRGGFGSTG